MENFIWKTKGGHREKHYKSVCHICGLDKGYVRKSRINQSCRSCSGKLIGQSNAGKVGPNKGKIFSDATRQKMSEAKKDFAPWNKALKETRYEVRLKMSIAKLNKAPWNKGSGQSEADLTIKSLLRYRLRKFIKGSIKHQDYALLAGCSSDELRVYLESKFQLGMSWENYGEWHLDHIRPLCSFDLTKEEELLKACCYTNLQPLWAKDNLSKGSKH